MKNLKIILRWIGYLLSDSKFASTRRFIGIQAFYNLVILGIVGVSANQELANTKLLMQLASYFFAISVAVIVGTTITDVAGFIKSSQINTDDYNESFNNISKDV